MTLTNDENPETSVGVKAANELRLANEEWVRALAHQDGPALDRIIADDFVLAYPFEGDDKGQFISDIIDRVITIESLEAHDVTIRVSGETGLVFGSETANWHYRGRDLSGHRRFLRVYTRQDGKWRIVALHVCAPTHHQ